MLKKRESIIHKTENSTQKVLLSGSLSDSSFFDIFREISLPKWTGTLVVKASKTEYRFYFRKGDIIYSENSKEKTELKILEIIKNSGLISRDTFVRSEKKKAKLMRTLLEILIEDGHVSMLLYTKVISAAVRLNILKMLLLKKGTYTFSERKTIREVHGVKPVSMLDIKDISSLTEKYPEQMKKVLRSFYRFVSETEKDHFLAKNKSVLQNYLICDIDFFTFIDKVVSGYADGKWQIQNRFYSTATIQVLLLYIFRAFVLAGVVVFLYLSAYTGAFKGKREERSVEIFYFFKIDLISSLIELETGTPPDKKQLLMSGFLKEEEIELSRTKENTR